MGCMFSTAAAEAHEGPSFRVSNVDVQGTELNHGKIKVAASDLILYQKGKEPIHWPLKYLRRYGFDAEVFSFESGRQCPTGQGIYAFKCHHAEDLFVTVQESIRRVGEQDRLRTGGDGGGGVGGFSPLPFTSHNGPLSSASREATHERDDFLFHPQQHGRRPVSGLSQHPQYVNGVVGTMRVGDTVNVSASQYVNTGAGDEFTPLIGFPGQEERTSVGCQCERAESGQGACGYGCVNYCVTDSVSVSEQLPREEEDGRARLHSAGLTLPEGQGSEVEDVTADDGDVFFADCEMAGVCPMYMNIQVNETPAVNEKEPPAVRAKEASSSVTGGEQQGGVGAAGLGEEGRTCSEVVRVMPDPAQVANSAYANLTWDKPVEEHQQKASTPSYILLCFENSGEGAGGGGGAASPFSSSSLALPLPPTQTSSYAKIDFNKTEALSHFSRGGADGEDEPGARKTRHNSSIEL